MQSASTTPHVFGRVSSRGTSVSSEERSLRRDIHAEVDAIAKKAAAAADGKESKKGRREGVVGRFF